MINEKDLSELSWTDAPKIVTESYPGPKTQKYLQDSFDYESMARGGGRFPFVFAEGKGATVKDPNGNIMLDITAGVAENSVVGRCHPQVIKAMQKQMNSLMHASDISNVRRTDLAKKVASVMPGKLKNNCITYFTQGGQRSRGNRPKIRAEDHWSHPSRRLSRCLSRGLVRG